MSVEGNVKDVEHLRNLRGKITTIPQTDPTLTKSGYAADSKVVGDALNERIRYRDIVDNLTTDEPNKPASARTVFLINKQLASMNLSEASTVGYNNSVSGLNAQNMQGAIDELAGGVKNSVSKKGDSVIEGTIHVRNVNANNGYGTFEKNSTATEDYGTNVMDRTSDGRAAQVNVSAALNCLRFTENTGNVRNVFHEGNKPFGTYTGNGIANERILDTGGIGSLMFLYSPYHFSFVTPEGALVVKLSTGTVTWMEAAKVSFLDGKLSLYTSNAAFNEVDTVYHYQVI